MAAVKRGVLASWICRIALAAVFLAAAIPKIIDPVAFAGSIDAYHIITGAASNWAALLLPWFELFIAFGLLTPWLKKASLASIAVLLCVFIGLHISTWLRGIDLNCGCFGAGSESSNYPWLLSRNFGLLLMAIYVWKISMHRPKGT